jgi:hypothetical protein
MYTFLPFYAADLSDGIIERPEESLLNEIEMC